MSTGDQRGNHPGCGFNLGQAGWPVNQNGRHSFLRDTVPPARLQIP